MVVLDTCAIIELCKSKHSISDSVIDRIDAGAYILSISFAEIAIKVNKKKISLGISSHELHDQYANIPSVDIIDIGVKEWLNSIHLDWPENKDPADRMITSFAMTKDIPIITKDKLIKRFYQNVLW